MFRRFGMFSGIVSLVLVAAGVASAQSLFYDLSGLAGDTAAYPCGVDGAGQVSLMGYFSTSGYYHQYLYTGGTAGTMNDINSSFTTGNTFSNAINGSGQMAVNGVVKAWLYGGGTGGTVTPILNGSNNTNATCIDSAGDVAGATVSGVFSPYVYTGGSLYLLDSPDAGIQAGIIGINDHGQACGYNKAGGGIMPPGLYATVWTYTISGGTIASQTATDISPYLSAAFSGYEASQAFAVNNLGNVVGGWSNIYGGNQNQDTGFYVYNIASHAVTSLPAGFSAYTPVNATATFGAGMSQLINDNNQVVGQTLVGGVEHAAIWSASSGLQDLNTLYASFLPSGFVLNDATAIDNNGDIVGVGTDSLGNANQAFLLRQLLPGDANEDGKVDINDLTIVLAHYGQTGTTWAQGEFTGDGTVDINDLTIVLAHYGQSLGATAGGMAAAPEPSCMILFGMGALALFVKRKILHDVA